MTAPRTVLVTGGAGGIGTAICTAFHDTGDRVVVADLDLERATAVAGPLGGVPVALDITNAESIDRALGEVERAAGPVDVLVNNAGLLNIHGALLQLAAADLITILTTNVVGTFRMTQQTAAGMVARGAGGVIVNLSSIGGRQPTPGMGGYESSKAAVDALTRWAAIELAEHRIRVNAVAPGPVATPMLNMGMPEGSPARAAWTSRIPLRDLASTANVAAAVVFLASDAAAHITGVSLPVDGGQLLA